MQTIDELEPIADPGSAALVEREISDLPARQRLVETARYAVLLAVADQIPHALYELGRLRELTFRAVGEGTGARIDLDGFDSHYLHLILWDRQRCEIAGGYRLGATDQILPRLGVDGLYTSTLFHYRTELLARLTPGLELGRSFIRHASKARRASSSITGGRSHPWERFAVD